MTDAITKIDARVRVVQLSRDGKADGPRIAHQMYEGGYEIDETHDALHELGFCVAVRPFMEGVEILHVSEKPIMKGVAAVFAAFAPEAFPGVPWFPKKEKE